MAFALTEEQSRAVHDRGGGLLVSAAAGSGKTRVLTSRIAYMIERGVAPFNILALTFTNKAAEQMRERIAQMLPDNRSRHIRMGTSTRSSRASCAKMPDGSVSPSRSRSTTPRTAGTWSRPWSAS